MSDFSFSTICSSLSLIEWSHNILCFELFMWMGKLYNCHPLMTAGSEHNNVDPGEMLGLLMVKWTFTGVDLFVGMIFRFPHSRAETWVFSLGLTIVDWCGTMVVLCELHKEKSCRIISTQLQQQCALTADTKY